MTSRDVRPIHVLSFKPFAFLFAPLLCFIFKINTVIYAVIIYFLGFVHFCVIVWTPQGNLHLSSAMQLFNNNLFSCFFIWIPFPSPNLALYLNFFSTTPSTHAPSYLSLWLIWSQLPLGPPFNWKPTQLLLIWLASVFTDDGGFEKKSESIIHPSA